MFWGLTTRPYKKSRVNGYSGTVAKEFCPKCGKQFECLTEGVYENGGALMVYSNDMVVCDDWDKYEV